jgi:uncharacterized protein (TIGR03437 family)
MMVNQGLRGLVLLLGCSLSGPVVMAQVAPPTYNISTYAGTGVNGYTADGGAASEAQLNLPVSIYLDGSGNLYVADQANSRIRKIAQNRTITTVAGNGTNDYTGNDGPATSASISFPCGVTVDKSGNLYFSDTPHYIVRKVSTAGTITAYAGTNLVPGYQGDAAAATKAYVQLPTYLATDAAGNVYIADTENHVIRKVGSDGIISTFAGSNVAGSRGDGGLATAARLNRPMGMAFDSAGNLYIADERSNKIRKVATDGTISTVAGTGIAGFSGDGGDATKAQLYYPHSVAVDTAGNLYIADTFNNRIRMVTVDGVIHTIAGNENFGSYGDGGAALDAVFFFPTDVAVTPSGSTVYVADPQNAKIRLLTAVAATPTFTGTPTVDENGVKAATDFGGSDLIGPGSWIEVSGENLAGNSRSWTTLDFNGAQAPTTLDGVQVTVGGRAAYVAFISPTLLRVQLPSDVDAGDQELVVTTPAGSSEPRPVRIEAAQPGIYAPITLNIGGAQYAAALLNDGSTLALPKDAVQGTASRPVRPGETIVLYGVGFGPVLPTVEAGKVALEQTSVMRDVQILLGDTPATLSYAGLNPGSVGMYKFRLVVPDVQGGDAVPLTFKVDGVSGSQTLYIAVSN